MRRRAVTALPYPHGVIDEAPWPLRLAYLRTQLWVADPPSVLEERDLGARCAETGPLWIVSAYNPYSQRVDDDVNVARHRALIGEVERRGASPRLAWGISTDGTWYEGSVAVHGLPEDAIRELAHEFGQHAVFEVGEDSVRVVGCTSDWELRRDLLPDARAEAIGSDPPPARCARMAPGHHPHVRGFVAEDDRRPVHAIAEDDGWIVVIDEATGVVERAWTHDAARAIAALARSGGRARLGRSFLFPESRRDLVLFLAAEPSACRDPD